MKKPEYRFYRDNIKSNRFRNFICKEEETDLWIGIDYHSFNENLIPFAQNRIDYYRNEIKNEIFKNPSFLKSHTPLVGNTNNADSIIDLMNFASEKSGTGPFAAVSGAIAQKIGEDLINTYDISEIVIENGGDIFLKTIRPINISIFAGSSPLSEKIAIEITPEKTPCGVCTSSGTIGHSFSYGKADAVCVVSKNTALADAWATQIGNHIHDEKDIEEVLERFSNIEEIDSLLIIKGGTFGYKGNFRIFAND